VKISSRQAADTTIVEISDGGLGIAPEVLLNLNADLNSGGEVTPETARRMGLLVVSRLANRHGVTVSLARNQRGGTTATVLLPSTLLRSRPSLAAAPAPQIRQTPQAPQPLQKERPGLATSKAAPLSLAERLTNERIKRGVPEPVDPDGPTPAEPAAAAPAAASSSAASDPIEAAINAVIRLPQREPGATRSAGAMPGAPTAPTGGSLFQRLKSNESDAGPATPEVPAAKVEVPVTEAPVTEAPVAEAPVEEPRTEAPAESWMVQASSNGAPAAPPAAATVYDSLDARSPLPAAADRGETPIFREMRSNWFNAAESGGTWTSTEIEAGWEAAEQVAEAPPLQLSDAGLPMRRPGKRLVPGGVTPPPAPATVTRDPEAIRARLAAHAAGVSRGRTAAVDTEPAASIEEGPA
jgi:hypothetical protein